MSCLGDQLACCSSFRRVAGGQPGVSRRVPGKTNPDGPWPTPTHRAARGAVALMNTRPATAGMWSKLRLRGSINVRYRPGADVQRYEKRDLSKRWRNASVYSDRTRSCSSDWHSWWSFSAAMILQVPTTPPLHPLIMRLSSDSRACN